MHQPNMCSRLLSLIGCCVCSRQLHELTAQLESALRTAAATYKQQTAIDPPLLHPLPLPNKPVATSYGSADLGAVTATRKVSSGQQIDSKPPQVTESAAAKEEKVEAVAQQLTAPQEASAVGATEATPLVQVAAAQPAATSETDRYIQPVCR